MKKSMTSTGRADEHQMNKAVTAVQDCDKRANSASLSAVTLLLGPILLLLAACGRLDDPTLQPAYDRETATPAPQRPALDRVSDRQLLWGDLHIHTTLSTDAYVMGVRTLPDDAYTFAKGGEIPHAAGYGIRLSRPLDFAAVTDHAEYLGVASAAGIKTPLSVRSLRERLLHDSPLRNTIAFLRTAVGFGHDDLNVEDSESLSFDAWREIIEAAERHYEPGRFTAFIGYEWTSMPSARLTGTGRPRWHSIGAAIRLITDGADWSHQPNAEKASSLFPMQKSAQPLSDMRQEPAPLYRA